MFRHEQAELGELGERLIAAFDGDDMALHVVVRFPRPMRAGNPPRWLSELRKRAIELLNHPVKELCRTARVDRTLIAVFVFLDPQHAGGRRSPLRRSTSARSWSIGQGGSHHE